MRNKDMKDEDNKKVKGAIKNLAAICCLIPGLVLCLSLASSRLSAAEAGEVIYLNPPPPAKVYIQPQPRVVPVPLPQYRYGQRRAVTTIHEAGRIMGQYYHGRDVRIGPIAERDLFYQADVRDRRGVLMDKIIVDKRTGRIRSIF
jgi:hypothetical protein